MSLPSTPETIALAFWQGFHEYMAGFDFCPYKDGPEAYAWGLGWRSQSSDATSCLPANDLRRCIP